MLYVNSILVDKHGANNKVGEQFTEIFIKNADSVGLVLGLLEEFEFKVRWPALKLLMHLSTNRLKHIQEIILVSPMGVSKLMDLLGDSREVIRNDVHFYELIIYMSLFPLQKSKNVFCNVIGFIASYSIDKRKCKYSKNCCI